ncbi:MAG: BrnT family toxin [Caulobacteraceae bacterium]
MTPPLAFEWDEEKAASSAADIAGGHVPFPFAVEAFYEIDRVFMRDTRKDYGEDRFWLFAVPQGVPIRVTFTVRGDVTRIISAHIQKRKERS